MSSSLLSIVALLFMVQTVLCVQEDASHGAHGKDQHNPIHKEHYHEGEHDPHYDHEAILGKSIQAVCYTIMICDLQVFVLTNICVTY